MLYLLVCVTLTSILSSRCEIIRLLTKHIPHLKKYFYWCFKHIIQSTMWISIRLFYSSTIQQYLKVRFYCISLLVFHITDFIFKNIKVANFISDIIIHSVVINHLSQCFPLPPFFIIVSLLLILLSNGS